LMQMNFCTYLLAVMWVFFGCLGFRV
jgi:hypothetical protein